MQLELAGYDEGRRRVSRWDMEFFWVSFYILHIHDYGNNKYVCGVEEVQFWPIVQSN